MLQHSCIVLEFTLLTSDVMKQTGDITLDVAVLLEYEILELPGAVFDCFYLCFCI